MVDIEQQQASGDPSALPRNELAQFERRLSRFTKVPPARLGDMFGWPDERLRGEVDVAARVLRRFAEAVVMSMEEPESAGRFLRELDLKSITRDHDWRAVFSTLRAREQGIADFHQAVIVKYLQYLSFRKRLLEHIYSHRQGLEETDGFTDLTVVPGEDISSLYRGAASSSSDEMLLRLPMGEAVQLTLHPQRPVEMKLGSHVYRLLGGQAPTIMDANGVTYFLRLGRNMVGRHPESDVVVDPDFGDVSRAHLILDWLGERQVSVVDLSSRGTFVQEAALTG